MKKIFICAALSLVSAAALADNYVRIPAPGMLGGMKHPAMPGGPVTPKGPVLSIDSSPIDFGTLTLAAIEQVSARSTMWLSNTGDAPASLSLSTIGEAFSLVAADNGCGPTVGAGVTCAVGLAFQPTTAGTNQMGTLSINSDGGSATVSLSGTALPVPTPLLKLGSVDGGVIFSEQVTGTTSSTKRITVLNRGTGPANISLSTTGPFTIGTTAEGTTCGSSPLAPNAQCFAMVKFTPVVGGKLQAGALNVTAEDGTLVTNFEGNARWAKFPKANIAGYSSAGVTFAGTTTSGAMYLTNTGTGDMTVTGMPYLEGHTAEYTLLPGSCTTGKVIAPNGSCSLTVQFNVQADAPSHAPVTVVVPNNGTDQYNVPGIQSAKFELTGPSFMSSGYLQVSAGATSDRADRPWPLGPYGQGKTPFYDTGNGLKYTYEYVTLTNRGNAPMTITGITQHGVPAIVTQIEPCGTLARWGTCRLKIDFSGLPVGVNLVQLRVVSDAGNPSVDMYQQVTIIP